MQNQDTTDTNLEEIEVHSRRAWALTSMLMTCIDHSTAQPSKEVLSETLSSIWEHLDAIGAEMHRINTMAAAQ